MQTGQRVREEVNKESTDFALIKLMEKLSDGFKPDMLLSDNGNLSEKNRFRSGIEKYYRYNKEQFDKLPPGILFVTVRIPVWIT